MGDDAERHETAGVPQKTSWRNGNEYLTATRFIPNYETRMENRRSWSKRLKQGNEG